MATSAQEPFVVKKDLNPFILTVPEYNLQYLLANLNSTLHSYLYTEASTVAGKDDFRQTTLAALQTLPIRHINFITPVVERSMYEDKGKVLYRVAMLNNDQKDVLDFVNHHLSKQPEQSAVVHDLLAFLAETMLDLNKQKRALQKEFLDWLVTTLHIASDKDGDKMGIEVLTGKSKLLEYAGDYQKDEEPLAPDALWDIIIKIVPVWA